MANDFTRADIISTFLFESGALLTASKGGVDLTGVNTPTEDTTNYKEGSCAMALAAASSQYAKILDADLPTGFPFKSGESNQRMTISCWIRPTTVDANKRVIWSKHKNAAGKRCLSLVHNSTQIYLRYNSVSTTVTDLSMAFGAMTANRWYHITVSVDGIGAAGIPCYWFRLYDDTNAVWYCKAGALAAGAVNVGTAEFRLGADDDLTANCYFDGQIDGVMVSNIRFHNTEAQAIKLGTFPLAGNYIYDYLYDPTNGNDSNDGFSATDKAFITMKKAFYVGDIIHGAVSPETAQSGTATATLGSKSVTGISGWTPAPNDVIRFDTDNTLYMIRTYSSGTITLYRPYRGTTGSGKVINKITSHTIVSQDWNHTACTGTKDAPIYFNGGMNFSSMTVTGFTILYGGSIHYNWYNISPSWWIYNKLGFNYFVAVWSGSGAGSVSSDCIYNQIFIWRCQNQTGTLFRCTFNDGPIHEGVLYAGFPSMPLYNCVINNPESGVSSGAGWWGFSAVDTIVNNLKVAGCSSGNYSVQLTGQNWGLKFVNPNLDEDASGGGGIRAYNNTYICMFIDVVFENPMFGSGERFAVFGSAYYNAGEINLVNINGVEHDHCSYFINPFSTQWTEVSPDYTIYNTEAPSVQVALINGGIIPLGPFYTRHYIPCEAGIAKTISAYMRMNSSYKTGAYTIPFMRLRWTTGTSPNLVQNLYDVPMADVVDTFELVSHAVTPSIQGSIIVEFYFNSPTTGAIGWYDDLGVT